MGRFFFHLRQGGRLIVDEEGLELPSLDRAKREALVGAKEVLAEAIKLGRPRVPEEAIVVADEEGRTLYELTFVELLPEPLRK